MMTRKKVIAQIAMMENRLHYQKMKASEHEKYLWSLVNSHGIVCLSTLLPAFLWGWRRGKEKDWGKFLKPLVKFGLGVAPALLNNNRHVTENAQSTRVEQASYGPFTKKK